MQQNLFFWILVPLGGGVHACVGMVCYHCIVHILNSSKHSIFFVSNSDLCSAILPNYLGTYSSALCQTIFLGTFEPWRRHLRSKTMAKVYPKSWFWMHAFDIDWPEQTLKIYMQYSMYFACNNDLCRAVLTNLIGDIFFSFLPHLSLEEGIWED